jgi:single-stranded-DNA-specific exonuclease
MPIIDENRTIVSLGLKIIEARPRLGISALINSATSSTSNKREINSTFIGFTLAPRLNSAGRMGNASVAVELLLAEDENSANMLSEELCQTNKLRQSEENRIVESVLEKIEEEWENHINDGAVIVLADDNWPQGVIGIVSSRITEKFGMPSILVTFEGMPAACDPAPVDLGKGSGRSVKGFNLVDALSHCSQLLEKYGGHELAAGLSLRRGNLDAFRKQINDYARPIMKDLERIQVFEAERELQVSDINLTLANEISLLIEPCGPSNPLPSFVLSDVRIQSIRSIGGGKHIKFVLEKDGKKFTGLYFGVSEAQISFNVGDLVDVMFNLSVNHYNGSTELQMILNDVRFASSIYNERVQYRSRLFDVLNGSSFYKSEDIIPSRNDFVFLYKYFSGFRSQDMYSISDSDFMKSISDLPNDQCKINFIKYRVMLEVFSELDIITLEYVQLVSDCNGSQWDLPEDICVIKKGNAIKVNLEDSSLLKKLQKQMID